MKKAKTLHTILGSKYIAVPDVKKLYIMALLHKYEKNKDEYKETKKKRSPLK